MNKTLFVLHVDKADSSYDLLLKEVRELGLFSEFMVLGAEGEGDSRVPIRLRDCTTRPLFLLESSSGTYERLRFGDFMAFLAWLSDKRYEVVLRAKPSGLPLPVFLLRGLLARFSQGNIPYGFLSSWNCFLHGFTLDVWKSDAVTESLSSRSLSLYPDGRLHMPGRAFEYDMPLEERAFFYRDHYAELFRFPHTLQVEISSVCNSRCPKCLFHGKRSPLYHPRTPSPPFMDESLFQKIVDEFSTFQTRTGLAVALNYRGESQLHPRFYEMLRYLKERGVRAVFNTNARLLDREAVGRLLDLELNALSFSVDSLIPHMYRRLQGGDVHEALRNIEFLLSERERRETKIPALSTIHVVTSETASELPALLEYFVPRMEMVSFSLYQEILDRTITAPHTYFDVEGRYPCGHLWEVMTILSSGKVIRCGYDFNHEDVLGDLTEESLYDIWNGPRMTSYREAMCRGDFHQVPICCDCPRWKAPYKKMEMLDGLLVSTQWEGKTIQMVKRAFEPAALRGVCSDLPRTTRILQ